MTAPAGRAELGVGVRLIGEDERTVQQERLEPDLREQHGEGALDPGSLGRRRHPDPRR